MIQPSEAQPIVDAQSNESDRKKMIIKNIISLCTGPAYDSTHHYRYRYSRAARSVKTIYFCRALVPSPTNDQKSTTTVAFIKLGNSLQSNLLRTLIFREFKHRVID